MPPLPSRALQGQLTRAVTLVCSHRRLNMWHVWFHLLRNSTKWVRAGVSFDTSEDEAWGVLVTQLSPSTSEACGVSMVVRCGGCAWAGEDCVLGLRAVPGPPTPWGWACCHTSLLSLSLFTDKLMMLMRPYPCMWAPWGPINVTLVQLPGTSELNPDQLMLPGCLVASLPSFIWTILCSIFIFNCPDVYLT